MPQLLRYSAGLNVPVLVRVLHDRTIRAELAHLHETRGRSVTEERVKTNIIADLSSRPDALLYPFRAVLVRFVDH